MISRVITTPKLTRSIPNFCAIGMKIGIVMMKIALPSRKHPRISTTMMIMAMMPVGVALMLVRLKMIWSGILLMDDQPAEKAGG